MIVDIKYGRVFGDFIANLVSGRSSGNVMVEDGNLRSATGIGFIKDGTQVCIGIKDDGQAMILGVFTEP